MDQIFWAAALVKISHNLIVQFRDNDVQKQRNCRVVVDANLNFFLVLFFEWIYNECTISQNEIFMHKHCAQIEKNAVW